MEEHVSHTLGQHDGRFSVKNRFLFPLLFALSTIVVLACLSPRAHAQTVFTPTPLVYPTCPQIGAAAFCATDPAYGAKCDGATDDTAALNNVLAAAANSPRSAWAEVFLPVGVCLVSNTITPGGNENLSKRFVVRGMGRGVTQIKLTDSNPLFQNAYYAPRPVFSSCILTEVKCGGDAQAFTTAIRDLTINTGYNNPGATAAQMLTNNYGGGSNIDLICPGNCGTGCGLDLTPSYQGPTTYDNVRIVGFGTGVCMTFNQYTTTFRDLTLVGQTGCGLLPQGPPAGYPFVVDGLYSVNSVPTVCINESASVVINNFSIVSPDPTNSPAIFINSIYNQPMATCVALNSGNGGCYGGNVHLNHGTIGANFPASTQSVETTTNGVFGSVSLGASQIGCTIVQTSPTGTTTVNQSCTPVPIQNVRETVPPDDPIGQWVTTGATYTGAQMQTTLNTCVGSPGTGTTVYWTNAGNDVSYDVPTTLTIPACVNRIIGFGANVLPDVSFTPPSCFFSIANRTSLLVVEDFQVPGLGATKTGIPYFCTNGNSLLLRDMSIDTWGTDIVATGTAGSPPVYAIDICNGVVIANGQTVYMWGFDSESQGWNNNTHVINNGSFVQIVSQKNEQGAEIAQTNKGGTTINFGGFTIQNQQWVGSLPMFGLSYGTVYFDYVFASNYPANRGGTPIPATAASNTFTGAVLVPFGSNPSATLLPGGPTIYGAIATAALPSSLTYIDLGGGYGVAAGDLNSVIAVGP